MTYTSKEISAEKRLQESRRASLLGWSCTQVSPGEVRVLTGWASGVGPRLSHTLPANVRRLVPLNQLGSGPSVYRHMGLYVKNGRNFIFKCDSRCV